MLLLTVSALPVYGEDKPIVIHAFIYENAAVPYNSDWLAVKEACAKANVDLQLDFANSANLPSLSKLVADDSPYDVLLYQLCTAENLLFASQGKLLNINDYRDYTPNFNKAVTDMNLEKEVENVYLPDGGLYYMPSLFENPLQDRGLIVRKDVAEKLGYPNISTYEELYQLLKAYKAENPQSTPLKISASFTIFMIMAGPSFGFTYQNYYAPLYYDYDAQKYVSCIADDGYRQFVEYFSKLSKEGLLAKDFQGQLDPDMWAQSMTSGDSIATYAFYDQIAGLEEASDIEGYDLTMYVPPAGPDGSHCNSNDVIGPGIMIPASIQKRSDYKQVISKLDELFFSDETTQIWAMGEEGKTYSVVDGKIVYDKKYVDTTGSAYKRLQLDAGCGVAGLQLVWKADRERSKYGEEFARINQQLQAMPDCMRRIPPNPKFEDDQAERVQILRSLLKSEFLNWTKQFLLGEKDVQEDWGAFENAMRDRGIEWLCNAYNDALAN